MTDSTPTSAPAPRKPGYEKRDTNVYLIIVLGGLLMVLFIFAIWFTWQVYFQAQDRLVQQVVTQPQLDSLRQARILEREPLRQYTLLDSDAGIYSIPIDSAMKMMAEEADTNEGKIERGGRK
jgi:hypothetical protein